MPFPIHLNRAATLTLIPASLHSFQSRIPILCRTPFRAISDTLPILPDTIPMVPQNCPTSARNTVRQKSERCPAKIGMLSDRNWNHCPTAVGIRSRGGAGSSGLCSGIRACRTRCIGGRCCRGASSPILLSGISARQSAVEVFAWRRSFWVSYPIAYTYYRICQRFSPLPFPNVLFSFGGPFGAPFSRSARLAPEPPPSSG